MWFVLAGEHANERGGPNGTNQRFSFGIGERVLTCSLSWNIDSQGFVILGRELTEPIIHYTEPPQYIVT